MRTVGVAFALAAALASAGVARAAEFRYRELVVVGPDDVIRGDFYAAGERVRIEGRVEGDLIVAAGKVYVTGTVTGDMAAAGGEVVLRGAVGDDLRVAGGDVTVEGTVGDHAVLASGQVNVQEGAEIRGEVRAAGGQVVLAGDTGAVTVRAGKLTVADTAHVRGDLAYASGKGTAIAEGATIDGAIRGEALLRRRRVAGLAALGGVFSLISLIASFIAGLFVLRFLPNKSRMVAEQWRARFGSNLLWGALVLILAPVLGGALVFTIVGASLGIGVLLLTPVLLYLGYLLGALAVGHWLRGRMARQADLAPNWATLLLGLVVLTVLGLVPVFGDLAVVLTFLAGLGALVRFKWELIKRLRADGAV